MVHFFKRKYLTNRPVRIYLKSNSDCSFIICRVRGQWLCLWCSVKFTFPLKLIGSGAVIGVAGSLVHIYIAFHAAFITAFNNAFGNFIRFLRFRRFFGLFNFLGIIGRLRIYDFGIGRFNNLFILYLFGLIGEVNRFGSLIFRLLWSLNRLRNFRLGIIRLFFSRVWPRCYFLFLLLGLLGNRSASKFTQRYLHMGRPVFNIKIYVIQHSKY